MTGKCVKERNLVEEWFQGGEMKVVDGKEKTGGLNLLFGFNCAVYPPEQKGAIMDGVLDANRP